jgi:hypothetical protein
MCHRESKDVRVVVKKRKEKERTECWWVEFIPSSLGLWSNPVAYAVFRSQTATAPWSTDTTHALYNDLWYSSMLLPDLKLDLERLFKLRVALSSKSASIRQMLCPLHKKWSKRRVTVPFAVFEHKLFDHVWIDHTQGWIISCIRFCLTPHDMLDPLHLGAGVLRVYRGTWRLKVRGRNVVRYSWH